MRMHTCLPAQKTCKYMCKRKCKYMYMYISNHKWTIGAGFVVQKHFKQFVQHSQHCESGSLNGT